MAIVASIRLVPLPLRSLVQRGAFNLAMRRIWRTLFCKANFGARLALVRNAAQPLEEYSDLCRTQRLRAPGRWGNGKPPGHVNSGLCLRRDDVVGWERLGT